MLVALPKIEGLKDRGVAFTTDYRKAWKEITGEPGKDLPEPEGVREPATNPLELEDKYLKGLRFPAEKSRAIGTAKGNKAPRRVVEVLERLEDKQYRSLPMLLEEVGT